MKPKTKSWEDRIEQLKEDICEFSQVHDYNCNCMDDNSPDECDCVTVSLIIRRILKFTKKELEAQTLKHKEEMRKAIESFERFTVLKWSPKTGFSEKELIDSRDIAEHIDKLLEKYNLLDIGDEKRS